MLSPQPSLKDLEAAGGRGCALLNGGLEFGGAEGDINERVARTCGIVEGSRKLRS